MNIIGIATVLVMMSRGMVPATGSTCENEGEMVSGRLFCDVARESAIPAPTRCGMSAEQLEFRAQVYRETRKKLLTGKLKSWGLVQGDTLATIDERLANALDGFDQAVCCPDSYYDREKDETFCE